MFFLNDVYYNNIIMSDIGNAPLYLLCIKVITKIINYKCRIANNIY